MLPLIGRACAMDQWAGQFRDRDAIRLRDRIDYDFSNLKKKFEDASGQNLALGYAYSHYALAQEATRYLDKHPEAVIVTLGCGLNTSARVAENGVCRMINIDAPAAIETREKLFKSTDLDRNIAGDILDPSWFDEIGFEPKVGAFFIVSGAFMDMKRADVEKLLCAMAKRFPGAAIAFDAQNKKGYQVYLDVTGRSGADGFTLEQPQSELEAISKDFESVASQGMFAPYMDPKPFGLGFSFSAKRADKSGKAQINAIYFKK